MPRTRMPRFRRWASSSISSTRDRKSTSMTAAASLDVSILSWRTPAHSDTLALKIAQSMGAVAEVVSLASATTDALPSSRCAVVRAEVLAALCQADTDRVRTLLEQFPHVFVYGFESVARH